MERDGRAGDAMIPTQRNDRRLPVHNRRCQRHSGCHGDAVGWASSIANDRASCRRHPRCAPSGRRGRERRVRTSASAPGRWRARLEPTPVAVVEVAADDVQDAGDRDGQRRTKPPRRRHLPLSGCGGCRRWSPRTVSVGQDLANARRPLRFTRFSGIHGGLRRRCRGPSSRLREGPVPGRRPGRSAPPGAPAPGPHR
jgi:hypothetical protein